MWLFVKDKDSTKENIHEKIFLYKIYPNKYIKKKLKWLLPQDKKLETLKYRLEARK